MARFLLGFIIVRIAIASVSTMPKPASICAKGKAANQRYSSVEDTITDKDRYVVAKGSFQLRVGKFNHI